MTAVEWLFEKLDIVDSSIMFVYFEQAKKMEKQQIIDAYQKGKDSGQDNFGYGNNINSEQYYNENYGN